MCKVFAGFVITYNSASLLSFSFLGHLLCSCYAFLFIFPFVTHALAHMEGIIYLFFYFRLQQVIGHPFLTNCDTPFDLRRQGAMLSHPPCLVVSSFTLCVHSSLLLEICCLINIFPHTSLLVLHQRTCDYLSCFLCLLLSLLNWHSLLLNLYFSRLISL